MLYEGRENKNNNKKNGLTTHLEKVTNLRNSAACTYAELLHSEGTGRMCAFLFLFFELVL